MAHVMVLDTIDEDIFVCGTCKAVFNSLNIFLHHKRSNCSSNVLEESHLTNDIVQSAVSDAVSGSIVSHHGNKSPDTHDTVTEQIWPKDLSCSTCKKKFKKLKSLLAHLKTHSDKPYQCPICGRCFVQNSHLQRHITSHRIWPDGQETTARTPEDELLSYTCPYCNIILQNYSQYRAHLKNHLSLKKFKCIQDDCMEFCDTVDSLLQHVSVAHENPLYSCHICSSTFNGLEEIAAHLQNLDDLCKDDVTQLKSYKCSQCDARFRKPEKLSLHILTENHNKMCIHCKKTFASDKRLRLHLQIHRKLKPYQCNICDSSFHMKKYLSTHMLKHGNRQFKCSICKYMFKRQDLLQRHMKLHQNKKMFKCPFMDTLDCKKEFSRSDKLKSHLKCHTKHIPLYTNNKAKVSQENRAVEFCIPPMNQKTTKNERS